jgi:hypothetical protein
MKQTGIFYCHLINHLIFYSILVHKTSGKDCLRVKAIFYFYYQHQIQIVLMTWKSQPVFMKNVFIKLLLFIMAMVLIIFELDSNLFFKEILGELALVFVFEKKFVMYVLDFIYSNLKL